MSDVASTNRDPKNWTDDLVSGHHVIDEQHRELLRRFEMLEEAVAKGRGFDEVKALAAFPQRYVLTHFNTEEQVMLAGKYPGSAKHADEHDQCKSRIFQFKQFIETESDRAKIINVAYSMLGIWVRDHILNHDIQFIQYVKEKKRKDTPISIDYAWTSETSKLWSPDFSIGDETIDEQHRDLVKWTEYVQETDALPEETIHGLLDFIHGFIFTHFTDEELLMIDIQFPDLQHHTELHCATREKFFEVKKWCSDTTDPRDLQALVLELFESYVEHIGKYDGQFKKYFQNYQACNT